MIEISHVDKWYGSFQALKDCTTGVAKGEVVVVCGPSGSGKSTLIKCVNALEPFQKGEIVLDGIKVNDPRTNLPKLRARVGMVFQHFELFPHLRIMENLCLAQQKVLGRSHDEAVAKASKLLDRVGLNEHARKYPAELSGGQQQRVALARALVFRPRALLLDEPLSALDAAHRASMRDEIRSVQRAYGIATLHVTHDQEEALSMADRVAVLNDGRLLQVATPTDLYDRPASRFVAGFVGTANLVDGVLRAPDVVDTAIGVIACAPSPLPAGSKVTVCFRPETLRIAGSDAAGPNLFSGEIRRDRFLGSIRRFDFAVSGGELLAETAFRGEVTRLQLPPEAVRLLPLS
jgi:ABC-type Fe3+/spermidine/putrescine transport system ATPase subunit